MDDESDPGNARGFPELFPGTDGGSQSELDVSERQREEAMGIRRRDQSGARPVQSEEDLLTNPQKGKVVARR